VKTRRFVLAAAMLLSGTISAFSADRFVYEQKAFEAARDAGKPILVHVTAPWCGECKAQKPIVAALAQQSEYSNLTIFDVDFDSQKDALRALNVQTQSTLVIYKNKTEVTRAVGITRREAIEDVFKKAL
jgi:thioredoxin 1